MRPLGLLLVALLLLAPAATGGERRAAPGGPIEKLPPFNVREQIFPSIEVHFELAGERLGDPLNDPILDAKITAVDYDGMGSRLGLRIGDSLTALNGVPIRGLTILKLAALVGKARTDKTDLVWDAKRGITPFTIRYNGKWDTPLPGQKR
ncbi:MAG TPA: PDZ domain-containing protein [Opitutaceae bacterium]|nr:PDZ domain-containing protein [Opitutaceae bacterium]